MKDVCYPCIPPSAIHCMRLLPDTLSFVPLARVRLPLHYSWGTQLCAAARMRMSPSTVHHQQAINPLRSTNPESFAWKHCALQGEYKGTTRHQKLFLPLTANFVCSIVPTFHGSFFCCAQGYTASHTTDKHVRPWNSFEQGMILKIIPEVNPEIN